MPKKTSKTPRISRKELRGLLHECHAAQKQCEAASEARGAREKRVIAEINSTKASAFTVEKQLNDCIEVERLQAQIDFAMCESQAAERRFRAALVLFVRQKYPQYGTKEPAKRGYGERPMDIPLGPQGPGSYPPGPSPIDSEDT